MTAFLQQVAKALLAEHGAALRDVAVGLRRHGGGVLPVACFSSNLAAGGAGLVFGVAR